MTYDGKSAIVTGAATGIGRALAIALVKEGAKVAIADIDPENAQLAVEEIESLGGVARAYHCDVVDHAQVADVFSKAFQDFGRIEFAFINAGVTQIGKLMELKVSDLDWMFKVNIFGALHSARCFVDESRKVGGGTAHISFTGSENCLSLPAFARSTGVGGYNMTKHALLSMAETFRFELKDEDIGVSLAVPGGVHTEILFSVQKRQEEFGGSGSPDFSALDVLPPDLDVPPVISPDQAVEIILKGVAEKQFYIPTHPHILEDFLERAAEIEAAFS